VNVRTDANDRPASWTRAVRVDRGRLAKATKLASGGVRVEGVVAKVGVLTYVRADGSTFRELLPREEAGKLDSLATLRDAAVTVHHPERGTRLVSPETYREDSVGHVSGEPRFDGRRIVADLAIQDAAAIARIDAGELVELSAGYECYVDPTPGTFEGQRYDAVQRARTYNHAALLPPGTARAGSEASLRLDGIDCADVAVMRADSIEDDRTPTPRVPVRAQPEMRTDSVKTERIDGIEYEIGSVAWQQARARFDEKQAKAIADAEKLAKEATIRADAATAERDVAVKERDEAKKQLAEKTSTAHVDSLVAARVDLVGKARPFLPVVKVDGKDVDPIAGKTDRQVMVAVLEKTDPELKLEGRSDEAVTVYFDAAIRNAAKSSGAGNGDTDPSPLARARADAFGPARSHADRFDEADEEVEGRLEDRWRKKR
jgi:hypothetical protein